MPFSAWQCTTSVRDPLRQKLLACHISCTRNLSQTISLDRFMVQDSLKKEKNKRGYITKTQLSRTLTAAAHFRPPANLLRKSVIGPDLKSPSKRSAVFGSPLHATSSVGAASTPNLPAISPRSLTCIYTPGNPLTQGLKGTERHLDVLHRCITHQQLSQMTPI